MTWGQSTANKKKIEEIMSLKFYVLISQQTAWLLTVKLKSSLHHNYFVLVNGEHSVSCETFTGEVDNFLPLGALLSFSFLFCLYCFMTSPLWLWLWPWPWLCLNISTASKRRRCSLDHLWARLRCCSHSGSNTLSINTPLLTQRLSLTGLVYVYGFFFPKRS